MTDFLTTESVTLPLAGNVIERQGDLEFVLEFVEKSNNHRQRFLAMWPELMDNYMVVPLGYNRAVPYLGHPSIATVPSQQRVRRSMLKDPETHQIVETLAAQVLGLLFGSRDYIRAVPLGFDDYEKARLLSRVLMSVLEAPGVFRTLYQAWKDSFILGTAILELGWEARARQQVTELPVVDDNGEIVGFQYAPDEVIKEGPYIGQTDGWDFYPDPSGTRIHKDMIGVAKRFRVTKQEAAQLADAGKFDREATGRAIDLKGMAARTEAAHGERFPLLDRSLPDKLGTIVGFEYWGFVPDKHADGFSNRVVTVLNGEIVRSCINPHRTGDVPFKEIIANPMTGRFYGMGETEVIRFLQDSTDHLLMTLSDAVDEIVRPQTMVGDTANVDMDALAKGARFVECRNPEMVTPLKKDYNVIQFAALDYQRRKQSMRESSGATNPLQGQTAGDRTTATEFSEVVRLASQRSAMVAMLHEKDDFPFIGKFVHSMLRQFLSDEGVAVLNGEPMRFSMRDIDYDADVRFVGSTQAQSKFQELASIERAIATIGPNLQMIPAMPDLFVRHLDKLQIPDGERIVSGAVAYVQAIAQAGMMQQSPAIASGGPPEFGTESGAAESGGQRVA